MTERQWHRFAAGGLGEIFAVSFTHPADVLKAHGVGCRGPDCFRYHGDWLEPQTLVMIPCLSLFGIIDIDWRQFLKRSSFDGDFDGDFLLPNHWHWNAVRKFPSQKYQGSKYRSHSWLFESFVLESMRQRVLHPEFVNSLDFSFLKNPPIFIVPSDLLLSWNLSHFGPAENLQLAVPWRMLFLTSWMHWMTAPWESSSKTCFETSQSWPLHLWHKPFPTWPLHQQSRWQIRVLDVLAPSKVWPQNLGMGWLIAHSWTRFLDAMLLYSHRRLAASRRAKVSTLPWPWTMTANRRRLIWLKRLPTKIWWLQWVAAWVEWAAWAWEWVVSCLALAWERWWTEILAMQLWLSPLPDLRMWRIQATLEKKSSESLLGGSTCGMQRKDSVTSNATLCSMKDIVARLSSTSIKGRISSLVRMSRLRVSFVTASFKRKSWSTQGWPWDGRWASGKACHLERDTDLLDAGNQALPEGSKLEVCSLQGLRVSLSIQQRRHRPVWMQLLWKAALWQKQRKKECNYSSQWYGCMISVCFLISFVRMILVYFDCFCHFNFAYCGIICAIKWRFQQIVHSYIMHSHEHSVRDFMGWKFLWNIHETNIQISKGAWNL